MLNSLELLRSRTVLLALLVLPLAAGSLAAAWVDEYKSGIIWPEPKIIEPGEAGRPPSDAVVLFDGKDLSKWKNGENWEIKDGYAITRKSEISTKEAYGDCQLHLEFATPSKVEGSGQGRGNSGVYMMGRYEIQILDSYDNKTYFDGQCGAIYKQQPPTVNACRKPGEWQTYDILFTAPRFDSEGKVTRPAAVTVLHNGVAIHNHYELQGGTSYTEPPKYTKHADREPISLQFHGNDTMFRNIWIRETVQPLEGKKPEVKGDAKE